MRDKVIELALPNQGFEVVQEVESLLVWNARESIIRVLALQVGDKLSEVVIMTEMIHRVCESFPADDGREMTVGLAMTRVLSARGGRELLLKESLTPQL